MTDFNWRNPAGTSSVYGASSAFPGFSLKSIYPVGFSPLFGTTYSDYQGDTGLRGDLSDRFSYDLSALRAQPDRLYAQRKSQRIARTC